MEAFLWLNKHPNTQLSLLGENEIKGESNSDGIWLTWWWCARRIIEAMTSSLDFFWLVNNSYIEAGKKRTVLFLCNQLKRSGVWNRRRRWRKGSHRHISVVRFHCRLSLFCELEARNFLKEKLKRKNRNTAEDLKRSWRELLMRQLCGSWRRISRPTVRE